MRFSSDPAHLYDSVLNANDYPVDEVEFFDESMAQFGILGMKWGIRRFRNEDGTLTEAGKKRRDMLYGKIEKRYAKETANSNKILSGKSNREVTKTDKELARARINYSKKVKDIRKDEVDEFMNFYERASIKYGAWGYVLGNWPGLIAGEGLAAYKYREGISDRDMAAREYREKRRATK